MARRYEFYVRVAGTISHEWAQRTSGILFLPREHKVHIFELTCNVLVIDISEIIDIFTCEDIISSHVKISYCFYQFITTRYTTDFNIINIHINITRLRIPTGERQTSWLFTSIARSWTWGCWEQYQLVVSTGFEPSTLPLGSLLHCFSN